MAVAARRSFRKTDSGLAFVRNQIPRSPETSQPAKHRAFVVSSALLVGRAEHASGKLRKRWRLDPHLARTGQRGEEYAFTAEQRRLHAAHALQVEIHARGHSHDAPGVDIDALARREFTFHDAAGWSSGPICSPL